MAATITVNPGESIQAAIDGAIAGDTILLAAGTHNITATVEVSKSVQITGAGATVQGTNITSLSVFKITSSDVTIKDLDITWSHVLETGYASPETADSLISIMGGAALTGIVVANNQLHVPDQGGSMSGWGARALTVDSNTCAGVTITGNTVYNTRNGIVVRYGNTAIVTDNVVYNTKGGIMQYTSSQADADNRIMTGNAWGTVHNEWDIVWNSASYDPNYADSVLAVSAANGEGYVVDRRDAAGGHAVGNRSHIFLNPAGATSVHEAKGNMNDPYATFALGVEAVIADGDIYVDVGTYQEQVVVGKNLEILGSGLSTIIQSPDTLGQYFMTGSNKNYPIIYVHDADDVAIRDLVVDGLNKGNDNYRFIGIAFFDAGGAVSDVEVRGIQNTPFSGAQHGIGIYAFNQDADPRTLEIVDSAIHDFQKNAMALSGTGLTVNVEGNTITGIGPTGITAQNGIQVGTGAGGVIQGNTIDGIWYTGPDWTATGILVYGGSPGIEVLNNSLANCQAGIHFDSLGGLVAGNTIDGSSWSLKVYQLNADVLSNTISDSYVGVYLPAGSAEARFNTIIGNDYGVYLPAGSASSELNFNSIADNYYGILNLGALSDASLNWWGDINGPSGEGTGAGDAVSDNVIFSPWLGIDPDGDPGTAGVQLVSPMYFVVDDIGPAPATGYLNTAIEASNLLPGLDSIEVRGGTYDASEPITDGVNIYSELGSTEDTVLNGNLFIDAINVLIGQMGQGFTINAPVTVGAGIDASTIHINWNDIYSLVTNGGDDTLDATFNYWGIGSGTAGKVRIYPLLPVPTAEIIDVMDEYGFNVMQAITFTRLLTEGRPVGWVETATLLSAAFGIDIDDAMAIIREYGLGRVKQALRFATDRDDFLVNLLGYASGGGGGGSFLGGGAGGSTGIAGFCVGCPIPLQLELVHPVTGEPVTDAVVSYSVCRTLEDGTAEIVALGVMQYDDDLGAYTYDVDTTGFVPGIYDIYLGTDDGHSRHFQVEVILIEV